MSQQNSIQAQIIAKAMKEETFRQELLRNPKAAIERELGITVPQGVTIAAHQDTPTTVHLVLPVRAPGEGGEELSDAELEQVQGGLLGYTEKCNPGQTFNTYPCAISQCLPKG